MHADKALLPTNGIADFTEKASVAGCDIMSQLPCGLAAFLLKPRL